VSATAATATVTITDNDAPVSNPVFTITNATTVAEAAGTVLVATVTRDDAAVAATIDVTVASGTATVGQDLAGGTQTVTFAAGQTTAEITVAIVDDVVVEATETFTVSIANPSIGTVGTASATISITDNDVAPPTENLVVLGIAGLNATVAGNNATDEVFTFNTLGARATGDNTQVNLSAFDVANDVLRIDLATANAALVALNQLNGVDGIIVQSNVITQSTLINFGPDANGDIITVTLQGITDASSVAIEIV